MDLFESRSAWLELVDYENYAKNWPHDENRFTFPEVEDPYDGTSTDKEALKNLPARGEASEQVLAPVSETPEGTSVGEARQERDEGNNQLSAPGSGARPAASTPLIIEHPRAATMRGRTTGWDSCDTCHARKRRCDHGKDGFIDPMRAARPHKKRKTKA